MRRARKEVNEHGRHAVDARARGAGQRPRRRHPGRLRHDRPARHGRAAVVACAGARAARDPRARADRDGRRQRRGRRRDLLPGRPELRHEPAVGAAAADPGADRQPGDGRAAGGRHRRRPRPADQRALRALLGLVLGRRPLPAQLPDDRHRVHRRRSRALATSASPVTSRCRSPRRCCSPSPPPGASAAGSG